MLLFNATSLNPNYTEQVSIFSAWTLILSSFPIPAEEKQPHSMTVPPPCLTMGWFVQTDVRG